MTDDDTPAETAGTTDDEPTTEELHCGVDWCGGVPTHPTGNCVLHQDREPNPAWQDL